jgi:SNF2 family DNA or RNA helicase
MCSLRLSLYTGLGKTVQIVSYIEHIYRVEKIKRPFLVVVPLSTVEHWRREFQAWTDMVCCVYHDRQRVWRDVLREYEWYFEDRPHTSDFLKFDILVTTYDTLIGDFDVIGQIPWRVAVVDEAHRLRNIKGKLLECMKEISARGTLQYGYQSRVLMTGTPLQNNTQELWTLLNFIEPYKFPSMEDFQTNFGNMANREQVEALQRKISPYMLRRVKEDVAKDIPAKEETVIDVELTSIQKQYYRAIFEHNHAFLNMGPTRSTAPKLMNIQMELRKCCNHPFLLDGVEQREMERLFGDYHEKGKFEGKSGEQQQYMLNESGYVMTSGKMVLLDKLLPKLRAEGHKVLIFSQMVKMLDLISEYADFRGFRHERLDGRIRGNERQKAIDRFETEEDSFMFLLSTRAGGVGINLTAAGTFFWFRTLLEMCIRRSLLCFYRYLHHLRQ